MRRTPLPRTDGGPERPTIGLAQHAIVTRAQALWSAFHPLYKELAFAFAIGDDRRFKRLIRPLNALAQDMADCQDILFKAWGIGDFDRITHEIAAVGSRTPEATAARAADIQKLLDSSAAVATRAEELGLADIASRLRYFAGAYRDMAEPVLPPLPTFTEQKDPTVYWHILQSFAAIRLAAENLRAAEDVCLAEARLRRSRAGETENLQNEPGSAAADGPTPTRIDPALHGTTPASAREGQVAVGRDARAPEVGSKAAQTPPAEPQNPVPRFQKAPLVPRPDGPVDFQTFYRANFQRADQQWTPPPRQR